MKFVFTIILIMVSISGFAVHRTTCEEIGDKKFSFQVGAFLVQENANRLCADLKTAGYAAYTCQKIDTGGRNLYLVRVGNYKDKHTACSAAGNFSDSEGRPTFVTNSAHHPAKGSGKPPSPAHQPVTIIRGEVYSGQQSNDSRAIDSPGSNQLNGSQEIRTPSIIPPSTSSKVMSGSSISSQSESAQDQEEYNGQGICTYADKSRYIGEFREGKKHGHGTFIYPDGRKYIGSFRNGRFNGQGTLILANGCEYKGEFRDGKLNGSGVVSSPDGKKFEGGFENGKVVGQGVLIYPDGTKYIGKFIDGNYIPVEDETRSP